MLPRRLTIAVGAVVLLTACAGIDGTERGAIRENVVEPGITAIDRSRELACSNAASSLRTAMESYELLEGEPAADEAAMVAAGLLRGEIDLWNVVDGQLVAEDPVCGDVQATVPATEIVTEESSAGALTVDGVLATFSDEDVVAFGGPDCARQLAVVFAGASQFAEREGVEPDTLAQVEAAGDFAEPVTLWAVVDDVLRPAAGSPCRDFVTDE